MSEPLDQRLQLVISKGGIAAIDDWRRQQTDLPSRSEAIRRLIEAGLKSAGGDGHGGSGGGSEPAPRRQAATDRVPKGKPPRSMAPSPPAKPVSKEAQLRALRESRTHP